jgi:hypothetical protein
MPNRYYKSTATTWNSINSWSATSPTASDNAGIPTIADDVIFTNQSSLTCNIPSATTVTNRQILNITTTGYTGTITLDADLFIYGNHTIGATTFNGAGWYTVANSATTRTISAASATFLNFALGVSGNGTATTFTISTTLNVTNIRHAACAGFTTNSSQVNISGSMTMDNAAIRWSGTTQYFLNGSGNGTFGSSFNNGTFGVDITINKTGGTITFLPFVRLYNIATTPTFTYLAGTVVTTGSTFYVDRNYTLSTTNGINTLSFNNVIFGFGVLTTLTLNSKIKILGNLTLGVQATVINGSDIEIEGNVLYNGGGNAGISYNKGTATIKFIGGTNTVIQGINNASTNALLIGMNLNINKSGSGKVTLVPTTTNSKIYFAPGGAPTGQLPMTITVTSGSLDAQAGSTVVVGSSAITYTTLLTLNTGSNTVTFPNLNVEFAGNQLNIT